MILNKDMIDCPFEYYYKDWDESLMGRLIMIPDFYSDSELEYLRKYAIDYDNSGGLSADVFPNVRLMGGGECSFPDSALVSSDVTNATLICDKLEWLWKNWEAFSVSTECEHVKYVFESDNTDLNSRSNNVPSYCNHHMQASPAGMRPYPIHNDGGKLMTILVPVYPDVNNSTIFHGKDKTGDVVPGEMVEWNVNHAYLFRASSHSYHSYVGGEANRYIMNINFFNNNNPLKKQS